MAAITAGALAFSGSIQNAAAASFDCSRARLSVERTICADALLSELDEKLAAQFRAMGGPSSPELLSSQARWLQLRNQCTVPTCISALYRARLAELSRLGGAAQGGGELPVAATPQRQPPRQAPRVPDPNAPYIQSAEVMVDVVNKTPKDIRHLRNFQNFDERMRDLFRFMTEEQRAKYGAVLTEWWASALEEIGSQNLVPSDIALLQAIAPNFPTEREAQLRRLAAGALAAGPGPALSNADNLLGMREAQAEPSDREVWEGSGACTKAATYDLVVLGPLEKADTAYLMWPGEQRTILRYTARYDDVIGALDLSDMRIVQSNDFVTLSKTANAEIRDGGATIVLRASPTCELRLTRKLFPASLLQGVARAKTDPTYVPSKGAPFCLSMLAWSHEIEIGAPAIDLSKGLQSTRETKLLVASALHDSMTEKFLGRSVSDLDTRQGSAQELWFKWANLAKECLAHPLYFDAGPLVAKLIVPSLGNLGNMGSDLALIPAIEARVKQVAQANTRFSETAEGFGKLREYVSPIEASLAPALSQVRHTVLEPLIRREAEIAVVAVQAEPPVQAGNPRPVDRLRLLADMVDALRSADQTPDVVSAEAQATRIINADLAGTIASGRTRVADAAIDVFSLQHLKMWKDSTEKDFGRFAAFTAFRAAIEDVSRRMDSLSPAVLAGLPRTVASAKNVEEIEAISGAIASLQPDQSAIMTSPMWQAYMRGLDDWFRAHTSLAAEPVAPPPAVPDRSRNSIFHSARLKNGEMVGAIYDHDFLKLRNSQADAFWAIVWMVRPINEVCHGTLTENLLRAVFRRGIGPGVFGTSADVQNLGAGILMQWLDKFRSATETPGTFMSGMVRDAAAQDRATADGELLAELPCDDADKQTFLKNAQDFLNDPTSGVPTDKLGVADMCRRALSSTEPSTAPYCTCAGPILERRLTAPEAAYLKSDPQRNYATVVNLVPTVSQELRKCRQ